MSWGDEATRSAFNNIFVTTDSIQNEWNNYKGAWNSFYAETKAKLTKLIAEHEYPNTEYNKTITQIQQNQVMINKRQEQLSNITSILDKVTKKLESIDCLDHSTLPSELVEFAAKTTYCAIGENSTDPSN
jgi:hypothetical protein